MLVLIMMTYTDSKKFHRVMYRPAFAVQARELTTQQSITQNQIEKMSDSMFKHGAMVVAGEANYDLNYHAVKLNFIHWNIISICRQHTNRRNIWSCC